MGLQRELIEDLASFSRKLRSMFDSMVKARNMTLPRARVCFMLNRKDGINQRDLAEKLELETPTLVRILDAMEKQGFVERRVAGSDRRAKEIFMTEAGRKLGREVDELASEVRAHICLGISEDDLQTTLRVVRTMHANMQLFREQLDQPA